MPASVALHSIIVNGCHEEHNSQRVPELASRNCHGLTNQLEIYQGNRYFITSAWNSLGSSCEKNAGLTALEVGPLVYVRA